MLVIRETVAHRSRVYLRQLGPRGEATTAEIAKALDVTRAEVVAALQPLHGSAVASRTNNAGDGGVLWRVRGDAS